MKNRSEYIFTHHLRERFVQRTQKKYKHISFCRKENCEECKKLTEECKSEVLNNRKVIDTQLAELVGSADENRSYINNAEFMSWYYEKYGFDKRFEFLLNEGIIFIVVVQNGKKVIVTCVRASTHIAGENSSRPKYNCIKKKRERTKK